jgi:hypothetical protein
MGLRYREFHDGSGKKHVAAQLAGALAPHTPHFLGPRPHLARRGAAPCSVDGVVYVRGLFFQRTQVNAGYSSSLQAFSYHYLSTHLSRKIFIRGPLSFLSSF